MAEFTHLHLHTQYSFLDGAIHMKSLFDKIKKRGMDAVAVTDHGNLFGAIDFYGRAKKAGIKPILGCEVNLAAKGRTDRSTAKTQHLTLLAKDAAGWRNLMYLVSVGYTEGFYYKPRIDKQVLRDHAEGIIALSGCLGGEIPKACKEGDLDGARAALLEYKAMFAPEHFFLELQSNGIPEQAVANDHLKQLARDESVPLVATNNCHYVDQEDAEAHDILGCIKEGKSRDDPTRWRRGTSSLWIKSPDDMIEAFADAPEAIHNTMRIRDLVKLELKLGEPMLPTFQTPDGRDLPTHLRDRAHAGLRARFKELTYPVDQAAYTARLDLELDIIIQMKFPGYFLIVADFINWSKQNAIPVGPGRGSGAGSLVAYALRITDLDPIPYNLLFERFLNPERVSMPDFDVDFCQERRGEVIEYVRRTYGENNVGQIGTFAQMKAKSVIKDVARALEVEFSKVNALTKAVPDVYKDDEGNAKPITIEKALELVPELRQMQESLQAEGKDIIGIAQRLEGLYRQAGMHAAGIVIADSPLWEHVPVFRGNNDELVAQFSMNDVEQAGLVKFDFLGLKTLDVVYGAERLVNKRAQAEIAAKDLAGLWKHPHVRRVFESEQSLRAAVGDGLVYAHETSFVEPRPTGFDLTLRTSLLPLADPPVYKLIGSGNTIGIFQLESEGFQRLLKRLKPDCFEDIVAAVALYRPGPLQTGMVDDFVDCKHGKKRVSYPHPLLEEILKPTFGGFVYQEQVMQAAQVMAGYSLGGADLLRRAMGKKKAEVMAAERVKFVAGCTERGIPEADSGAVFDLMEKFAGYGFNKSHSAAYALITFQTAYLKTYYPVEFMAALMSTELANTDSVVKDIAEAKSMGVSVLPPTVNDSEISFSVSGTSIRFGLGAIKGLGETALAAVLEARKTGRFKSLYDFCERVSLKQLNKKTLETLVRSGAFDDFGHPRARLAAATDGAIEAAKSTQRDRAMGQESLFGAAMAAQVKPREVYDDGVPEWPERERLRFEKEALGFYVSGHPLERYAGDIARFTNTTIARLGEQKPQTHVAFAALPAAVRAIPLKDGSGRLAFVIFEDQSDQIEIRLGPEEYAKYEALLATEEPLLVKGRTWVERFSEEPTTKVKLTELLPLEEVRAGGARKVQLMLADADVTPPRLRELLGVISEHRGECPISVRVALAEIGEVELRLPEDMRLPASEAVVDRIEAIFGRGVVRFG